MQDPTSLAKVAILLCTYQGQNYLREQLASISRQTHANWSVWVSDDGSQDATLAILSDHKKAWRKGSLMILSGPKAGFAANFLSLTCNPSIQADYYAYSDQDDVWDPDKLERALSWLRNIPSNVPALYCGRTRVVDAQGRVIGFSPLFKKPPSFANALVQSLAGANTMVFNQAARQLICEAGADTPIVSHDWWAYLVVTGCGGEVFYDHTPALSYRQHSNNLVGVNATWAARLVRFHMLIQGRFSNWNERNITALEKIRHRLLPYNRVLFDRFKDARHMDMIPRLVNLSRSGIYRQTYWGNIGLVVAAALGKI